MKTDLTIKKIVVLAEMSDGKVYNVLTTKSTQQLVIDTISICEKGIQLLDQPVEGIEVTTVDEQKKKLK